MANTERVSLKDKHVQAELEPLVGKIVEVHGILVAGDPINKLEGEALEKDIKYQRDVQHRRYLTKEPYIKFRINDVQMDLTEKNIAKRIVYQNIFTDKETGVRALSVESKTKFSIGYRNGDKITAIKLAALEGRRFAFNQGLTVTYEVYKPKDGDCGVGLANIIFDEKPKFYEFVDQTDRIGAVEGQNWSDEVDDLGLDAAPAQDTQAAPASEATQAAPAANTTAPAAEASAPADESDWGAVWG
jgi:hypothetical protein